MIIEVDAAKNAPHYGELLAFGGTSLVYGSSEPNIPAGYRSMMARFGIMRFFVVYLLPPEVLKNALAGITTLLEKGDLLHPAPKVFSLTDAKDAHEHVEQGLSGKALIQMRNAA